MTRTLPMIDILTKAPADGAIFTTSTLSLAWFEQRLLRPLLRSGATKVAVLADPRGISNTTREGLATGPGCTYALEAVQMPGVFHAKIAFLWTRDTALLAVGSGNLSLAEMEQDLGCWEVFWAGQSDTPEAHQLTQTVARGAMMFFEAVQARIGEETPAQRTLDDAIRALSRLLPTLPEDNGTRWLDSFNASIGDQIADHVPPTEGPRTLDVLSPVHHPTGTPVRRLVDVLCPTQTRLLFTNGTTTFPVRTAALWAGFTTGELPHAGRRLQARVYRISDPHRSIIVTGSADATEDALWSNLNAEVCILRHGNSFDADELLSSRPASPEEQDQEAQLSPHSPLSIAWVTADHYQAQLQLKWSGVAPPEDAEIEFLGCGRPVRVPWTPATITLPLPQRPDSSGPLRLCVRIAEHTARAWVGFVPLSSSQEPHMPTETRTEATAEAQRSPVSVPPYLFEDRFLEVCADLTEAPSHPEQIVAYLTAGARLSLRYRLQQGCTDEFWDTVARLTTALARSRGPTPAVISLLQGRCNDLCALLLGLIAAQHQRGDEDLLSTEALHECQLTLERASKLVEPVLTAELASHLGETTETLKVALAELSTSTPAPQPAGELRWAVYQQHNGRHTEYRRPRILRGPTPVGPGRPLRSAESRVPAAVAPGADCCPTCKEAVGAGARERLARRELVRCECGRWLLTSEAS